MLNWLRDHVENPFMFFILNKFFFFSFHNLSNCKQCPFYVLLHLIKFSLVFLFQYVELWQLLCIL